MLDQHRLLVLERVDLQAKIYRVDLRTATDIFGSRFDVIGSTPTLESLKEDADLAAAGVDPLSKDLVIDLDSRFGEYPEKIEGLAVLDGRTIAIANDKEYEKGKAPPVLEELAAVYRLADAFVVVTAGTTTASRRFARFAAELEWYAGAVRAARANGVPS